MSRVVSWLALVVLVGCKQNAAVHESEAHASPIASGGGPIASAKPLLPGATCPFPEVIEEDVTIPAGCVVDVTHDVLVSKGKTLTIEPGVRLRFQPNAFLEIGHRGSRLVAKGTKDKPIVFTSSAEKPQRGDWIGLVFDDAVGEGTVLENAIVEYGGRRSHGGQGAITVFRAFPAGRVAIRDTRFQNNLTAISDPHDGATFGAFERNVFKGNEQALRVRAGVLAAVGANNDLADPVEVVGGAIKKSGTFPKTKSGIRVLEPIQIGGEGSDVAAFTLPEGAELRFAPKTWLEIGTTGPADFTARSAVFTSNADKPAAGDWVGLFFGDKTRHALVAGSRIEYAGAEEHNGDAAVTFIGQKTWQGLDVTFAAVTFRSIQQAHFSSNGDGCDKALDPRHGIVWAGMIEPCR